MTVARLPNGCTIAQPSGVPTSTAGLTLLPTTTAASAVVTTTTAITTSSSTAISSSTASTSSSSSLSSCSNSLRSVGGGGGGSAPATAESVLRELNREIANLEQSPVALNPAQVNRLSRLKEARGHVLRKLESRNAPRTNSPGNVRARPPASILPAVRNEALNLLLKHHLLPMNAATACSTESVLVEFRLSPHRYQLYLTPGQKAELEHLLYSLPAIQRKADLLTVYQHEQTRFFAEHPRRVTNAAASASAAAAAAILPAPNNLRMIRPTTSQVTTTTNPGGLQQQRPIRLQPQQCVIAPSISSGNTLIAPSHQALVRAAAVPSTMTMVMPLAPRPPQPPPPPQPQPAVSTTQQPQPPSSSAASSSVSTANKPAYQLSETQSQRLSATRALFLEDQTRALSAPPQEKEEEKGKKAPPTLEELIGLLAPYHVLQDMDNTPQALAKVDGILDRAFHQLSTRKRQTEEAIDSMICAQKWQCLDYPRLERISMMQIALKAEQARFEAERAGFSALQTRLANPTDVSEARLPPAKRLRLLLADAAPDFVPLEFDDLGNPRPARLDLGDLVEEPPVLEEEAEQKTDSMNGEEEEEEVVKAEDGEELQHWPQDWEMEGNSLFNGNALDYPPSLDGGPKSQDALDDDVVDDDDNDNDPFRHQVQHSEDPTVDAAIRSIIDL